MNKFINITILVLLAVFISFRINIACNELRKSGETEQENTELSIPSSFTGILPCADCPGIQYVLTLDDNSFTEVSWYKDRSHEPFVTEGSWDQSGDTLRIFENEQDHLKTFLIEGRQLILLDQGEGKITGDLEDKYRLEPVADYQSVKEHHNRLRDEGVEFIASGNEPFWSVRISNDEKLTYTTPDTSIVADTFVKADVEDKREGKETIIYYYRMDSSEYVLQAEPVYCQDTMSGFLFTHTVQFSIDETVYEGCGKFLN